MTTSPTPAERAALRVAQAATMTPDASYDMTSAIVFALGSAQLLQSPETAAELEALRSELSGRKRAYADAVASVARLVKERTELEKWAAADRTERDQLRARVAELEAETYVAPSPSCTRCYGADAVRFVDKGGATSPCRVCGPSECERLRARVAELEQQLTTARNAGYAAAIEVMRQEKLPMSVGLLEAQRELDALDAADETEGAPVPFVLTERAEAELVPSMVTTSAKAACGRLRKLLHPLDGGERP